MEDDQRTLEMLKLITSAEHHFNNLTFNIRALASTWLLATFAGVGWILKDWEKAKVDQIVEKPDLIIALCIGSSVGIFVLWLMDLKVYQAFLNVWFDARTMYEDGVKYPTIRKNMKELFKTGRAVYLIKFYYLVTCAAPLLIAAFIAYKTTNNTALCFVLGALVLLGGIIIIFSPKDEEDDNNNAKGSVTAEDC